MNSQPLSPQEAATIFVERFLVSVYDSSIKSMTNFLEADLVKQKPQVEDANLKDWYRNLDETQQLNIQNVISKSVSVTVFGALAVIDNIRGGYPLEDIPSEFAVYVQTYADKDMNQLLDSVRLNTTDSRDLHDTFLLMLDERQSREQNNKNPNGK